MTADEEKAIAALEDARIALVSALERLGEGIEAFKKRRLEGMPVSDAYGSTRMRDVRDLVLERLASFDRAFTQTRAAAVRHMVDNEGMTLTAVARLMRRSRQFVTRLYRTRPLDDAS